jgi:hypothetical protein
LQVREPRSEFHTYHLCQFHSLHPILQGRSELAVEYYHKALGLKPDDSFTHEMLNVAMQEHTAWFAQLHSQLPS